MRLIIQSTDCGNTAQVKLACNVPCINSACQLTVNIFWGTMPACMHHEYYYVYGHAPSGQRDENLNMSVMHELRLTVELYKAHLYTAPKMQVPETTNSKSAIISSICSGQLKTVKFSSYKCRALPTAENISNKCRPIAVQQ
jgi:hypothetical protein